MNKRIIPYLLGATLLTIGTVGIVIADDTTVPASEGSSATQGAINTPTTPPKAEKKSSHKKKHSKKKEAKKEIPADSSMPQKS